jgi:creatinine amidohydrolase
LLPVKIEAIIRNSPIAYLPWGALEFHGQHNPIGLDSHKAYHLCVDLAKVCGGLVFPPMNVASNLISSYPGVNFPRHSIEFSEALVTRICEEYLDQLAAQGFKIIVLLSGHAGQPHLNNLFKTSEKFNKKYAKNYCWALAEFEIIPEDLLKANHSGEGETSLELHYEGSLVNLGNLPHNRKTTLEEDAVSGQDPRNASAELGQKIAHTFVTNAFKKMEDLKGIFIR